MQSDQEELKNLQKLTEKLKSSHCVLCGHKLFPTAYIINNLDHELVREMEIMNPGALKNLCSLYSVNLQLEKEKNDRKQRKTKRK